MVVSKTVTSPFYKKNNTVSEASYPHTAKDGSCKSSFTTAISSGSVAGFKGVFGESSVQMAFCTVGPVSVVI